MRGAETAAAVGIEHQDGEAFCPGRRVRPSERRRHVLAGTGRIGATRIGAGEFPRPTSPSRKAEETTANGSAEKATCAFISKAAASAQEWMRCNFMFGLAIGQSVTSAG